MAEKAFIFCFFLLLTFLSTATPAQASVLSTLGEWLGIDAKVETAPAPIANSQNMTLLQAALNLDPNPVKNEAGTLLVGGTALFSESGPLGTIADIEEPKTEQISVYTVQVGDSLASIADHFGVSVNTLLWANNLSRQAKIKSGDTLVILPISGIKHIVKRGDTLISIAKLYSGDAEEIARYNGIEGGKVILGATIIIPNGELPLSPARAKQLASSPSYSGYFMKPLSGARRTQGLHGHNGVDLQTYSGDKVYAAAAGRVIVAASSGYNGGYGKYIVIAHPNGTQTLYGHLNSLNVGNGQQVEQGEVIGYEGSTGLSTGTHLHFEVRGAQNPF